MAKPVVEIAAELIRIDTSNFGDNAGPGEIEAAEYVARFLLDLGLSPEILGPNSKRASVVCKIPGARPHLAGLLLHGHLDVVPANPDEWQTHPFKGEVIDGVLWGRGAVDMKGQVATILAAVASLIEQNQAPTRDVTLLFTADEEAGGRFGAHWLVENHPEVFEGVGYAIGEVGGFNHTLPNGKPVFFIQVGEKGMYWVRLKAQGTPGHGSLLNNDNAVATLSEALARISNHDFAASSPIGGDHSRTANQTLVELARHLGQGFSADRASEILSQIGSMGRVIGASLQDTLALTVMRAGEKVNVIPAQAEAEVDGRYLPGHEKEFIETVEKLVGSAIDIEVINADVAYESPLADPVLDMMLRALQQSLPSAVVVPYLMPGGTDAKALTKLGITCYGFLPMLLPEGFDAMSLFHAADERVPVQSLEFGVEVLRNFLLDDA